MKSSITSIVGIVLFVVASGVAGAQSLAEVAKQEKKRRSSNTSTVKTVITERELSSSYGGLSEADAAASSADAQEGQAAGGDQSADDDPSEVQDETRTREYWQNRVNAAKEKIARLEQQAQSESWGDGQRFGVDPMGSNNLSQTQQNEQQLQEAKAELAAIQAEGRRAGVPPGWVR